MRLFLISIIFISLSAQIFPQEKLTLEDAINVALHKNSSLLTTANNLESVESNVQAAWGNFLPSLGAEGGWLWRKSDQEGFGVDPITGQVIDLSQESRSYSIGLGSNWTLFDGLSNFANLSQSKNNLESAEFSFERLKQDIVFQTMTLYYNIVYTKQLLDVKEDNLKWNQKNLETIKERNRLGAATLADVYQQQVATGNAELEIINTQNQLQTSKKDLLFYLGLDVLDEYGFTDTLTAADVEILNTDLLSDFQEMSELVDAALNQRLDFKSAMLNLESAKAGITIAQSGHWPSLLATGKYEWSGGSFSEIDRNKSLRIGLSLNFPIFNGWSVSDRVQFAEVQAKNTEIELSDLERDIKRQLNLTFLDLQAAQKGLTVSGNNVAAANENLKIEEEKYSLGSGKLLDVLIANSRYTTALSDLINAQFSYIVFSQQLKYQLGILDYKQYEK